MFLIFVIGVFENYCCCVDVIKIVEVVFGVVFIGWYVCEVF